jgi:TRAP transporter TAXI family solute receptor
VVRLIVSNAGGVDYTELLREYGRAVPNVLLTPYDTSSSVAALTAIQQGQADLGFLMADLTYLATVGRLDSQKQPFVGLRAILASGVLPLHLVVRDDSGILAIGGLRGHAVNIGVPGSAIERMAVAILEAFGIKRDDVMLKQLPQMQAAQAMGSGSLQAMFVVGGFPGASPAEAVRVALRSPAHLVPILGAPIDRLRQENRYLHKAVIPERTYDRQPEPIETIGIQNLLICRRDLDEQLVYELTKGFFEAVPRSPLLMDSFRFMDLDQAAATSIPLHEGAATYYRERELFQ